MARSFSSFPDWNAGRTVVKYRYHRAKGAAAMRYTLMHKEIPVLDMDFLAKVCYVLDCRVEDVLEYEEPAESAP